MVKKKHRKTSKSLVINNSRSNFVAKIRSTTPDFNEKCGVQLPIFAFF